MHGDCREHRNSRVDVDAAALPVHVTSTTAIVQTTDSFMTGKSEGETAKLAEDVYDVVSSWLTYKKPVPERWKDNTSPMCEKCLFSSYHWGSYDLRTSVTFTEIRFIGEKGRSNLVSRARKRMSRLKTLARTLNEVASAIQAEAEGRPGRF